MMSEEGEFSYADDYPQTSEDFSYEFEDEVVYGWTDDCIYDAECFKNKTTRLPSSSSTHQASQIKHLNKINIEKYEGDVLPTSASNMLMKTDKKAKSRGFRIRDKEDRATVQQTLDPTTLSIIAKLISSNKIDSVGGSKSTGKEANVYHSPRLTGEDYALKIYKTNILKFKDRERYVNGDYRFSRGYGYNTKNTRQMVQDWGLKEFRNLSRMHAHGLNVPKPILIKGNVLIMTFIGNDGWPAPLLKDVDLSYSKYCQLYQEAIILMWKMYNECQIVHADFSEYNIMYHDGKLVVIDVSQSVEHQHPGSLEFLRRDCINISEFFRKKLVAIMNIKELFNFITDPTITKHNMEAYLEKINKNVTERIYDVNDIEDEVFTNIYIPKRLDEVIDIERDINKAKNGEDLVYTTITGLKSDLSGALLNCEISENDSDSEQVATKSKFKTCARPRDESPNNKKERKKAVRDEKAIKRETKTKKHKTKTKKHIKK